MNKTIKRIKNVLKFVITTIAWTFILFTLLTLAKTCIEDRPNNTLISFKLVKELPMKAEIVDTIVINSIYYAGYEQTEYDDVIILYFYPDERTDTKFPVILVDNDAKAIAKGITGKLTHVLCEVDTNNNHYFLRLERKHNEHIFVNCYIPYSYLYNKNVNLEDVSRETKTKYLNGNNKKTF